MANIKLYTISEVAEILRVTRQTVYNWIKSGKIRVVRLPNGFIRITEDELKRILNMDLSDEESEQ